ncbi:tubulin-tyrosine ligase/Tubulin polyglutamylase [Kipferlia bialata]|uniref:Tubulin-tyrosine ligase/Tubulin polyglutamylase n=1 Tax=Kipferlia bialata TaxID=797122 RepID=A0A9K3D9C2_9EUKA|nr:tubulin-tyrosine ligase/Tubulin polyglutamylase [Kipferlia bialata]|eukprot:g12190.t1
MSEYGETDEEVAPVSARSTSGPKTARRRRKRAKVNVCLDLTHYPVLNEVCEKGYGMKVVGEDDDWNLLWTDRSITPERLMKMKSYQRINHFPGMHEITRKDALAKNLNRMRKQFGDQFDFYPQSWHLPYDMADLRAHMSKKKGKGVYISKPSASCQVGAPL